MSYIFGDGFDLYASPSDLTLGYWDSGTSNFILTTGRFTGSQAVQPSSGGIIGAKSSGQNDAVHHFVISYFQAGVLSGTTLLAYLQLLDGTNGQCCVVFRSDGAILLTSATPAGTVLDTYTGAVTAQSTWFAFEFEVIINNTTGSWAVRKNGNTSNDHALGSLNTRPGSANNYANKLQFGVISAGSSQRLDDLLWRSDASSVAWMGDIRCYTRMPSTTASAQFSVSPSPIQMAFAVSSSISDPTGTSRYTPFTPTYTGSVGTLAINVNTGFTGNLKCSIFADSSGNPGAVLGSATTITNPVSGANTFTFGTPVSVVKGTQYWFGVSHDVTAVISTISGASSGRSSAVVTYASFPTASPTVSTVVGVCGTVNITPSNNAEYVNEAQQDGTTSYVYDSTVSDADFYNIAALSSTPASVIAVTTRGFMEKSDAGTRTGTVQLKSGSTTVAAPTLSLSTNFGWAWRTDAVDPNTSAAWTPANVNSVTIGPVVIS